MDDERRSASPPFLAADLDALHTPPEHGRAQRNRSFGASRLHRHVAHEPPHGGSVRSNNSNDRGVSNSMTQQFSRVAGETSRRLLLRVPPVGDFNFGDDADVRREQQQHPPHSTHRLANDSNVRAQQQQANGGSKYKPRASGKAITPGASFQYSGEAHLQKSFFPPRETDSFILGIVDVSDKAKGTRLASSTSTTTPTRPMRMRASTSALELGSAPSPSRVARPTASATDTKVPTLRWHERKRTEPPPQQQPLAQKPRITLTPGKRGVDALRSPPRLHISRAPVTRQSTLPRRNRDVLLSLEASTRRTTMTTATTAAITRTRAEKQTDGTADQPIDLDTDSEHDSPPVKRLVLAPAPSTSSKPKTRAAAVPRLKPPHWKDVDLDAIRREPKADLSGMVVWIGRVRCCADVYLRSDCLWLCSIRSTLTKWDRMDHLKLCLADCKSVHVYRYDDDKAPIPDANHGADERLLAKSSFAALCAPCSCEADIDALRSFYDPLGTDTAKKFIVIEAPEYDRHGMCFEQFETFFADHFPALLHMVMDVASGKQFLQALVAEPYNDAEDNDESTASAPDGTTATAGAASHDDNSDSECFDVQLTYPLPPCSSDIVTITRADISRLRPEQYLNDNIIDYYFKRLMLEDYAGNAFIQQNVLFLSSHFYSRLRAGKGASVAERLRAGYRNIATWVARTDFFSRHLVFIPINKDMHWSLAVILNPRSAAVESPSEDQPPSCIAVLDPLGGYHNKQTIARHLRSFLQLEWESTHSAAAAAAKDASSTNDASSLSATTMATATTRRRRLPHEHASYNVDRVALVTVKAPRQQNSYDCGVYVLKFAEVMLGNYMLLSRMFDDTGPISKDLVDNKLETLLPTRCISPDDITDARAFIQQSIREDTERFHHALAEAHAEQKREAAAKDPRTSVEVVTAAGDAEDEQKGGDAAPCDALADADVAIAAVAVESAEGEGEAKRQGTPESGPMEQDE